MLMRATLSLLGCFLSLSVLEFTHKRCNRSFKKKIERMNFMDQKTMGSFIAALRKTSGMTQRQLAEMLAVSDKTISHWERGESAPDLSMIPVLAEIFGVTCDEILKGEKINAVNNEAANNSVSRKCEKQIKYLFEKSLRKLKMSAVISLTLIIFGFILGIALNLFLETRATYAAISYIVALLFYICAVLTVVISRFIFKTEVYETPADESITKAYNQKANCLFVYPIFTAVVFAISSKSLTSYYRPVEYMFKALLCDFGIFGCICTVIFILIVCIMKKGDSLV